MRRLLGLFRTREDGLRTLARLRAAGFQVETLETPTAADRAAREAASGGQSAESTGPATGAALGALSGGLIGAVPGALVGALASHGLGDETALEYQRVVGEGGIVLVVDAPEIQPATEAEDLLREGGAVHVHTGEVPRA